MGMKERETTLIREILCLLLGGKPAAEIDLVWPLPPEKPRLRWIRSISSAHCVSQSGWSLENMFTELMLSFGA